MPRSFALQFDLSLVGHWASRYSYQDDSALFARTNAQVRRQGYYEFPDFLALCRWKARRAEKHFSQNAAQDVKAVTGLALSAKDEQLKISLLMALKGVSWPMASALLHFGASDPYPILDVRALWSLGIQKPPFYTFAFWWAYTQQCRELANKAGVPMRTLDRALWQFSKEHQ